MGSRSRFSFAFISSFYFLHYNFNNKFSTLSNVLILLDLNVIRAHQSQRLVSLRRQLALFQLKVSLSKDQRDGFVANHVVFISHRCILARVAGELSNCNVLLQKFVVKANSRVDEPFAELGQLLVDFAFGVYLK